MKRIFFVTSVSLISSIFIAGCKKDVSKPNPNLVLIQNMAFSPQDITIAANTTITWTNKDNVSHNVTSDSGWFSSGNIAADSSFSQQCNTPGRFTYKCSIHSNERGSVTVR